MKSRRHVEVRAQDRHVGGDVPGGEVVSYTGISLIYRWCDHVISEIWIPVGDNPSLADDEALIAAMSAALHWSEHAEHPR
jgi:hypothetical protein